MAFPHAKDGTDEWYTPPECFRWMGIGDPRDNPWGWQFDLDVCSPGPLLVPWIPARAHLTAAEDGLRQQWSGVVWCNPPYSNAAAWVDRFIGHGNGVILVNSATDAAWFHRLVHDPCVLFFPAGRIRFLAATLKKHKAPPRPQVFVGIGAGEALVAGMESRHSGTVVTRSAREG